MSELLFLSFFNSLLLLHLWQASWKSSVAGFHIAGTVALARAVGLCRVWTLPVHTWEPSNTLMYSQGFLYSRHLAKSELCGMYSHVL